MKFFFRIIPALFLLILLVGCESDTLTAVSGSVDADENVSFLKNGGKIDVCHLNGGGEFSLINVSQHALGAHQAHGDAVPGDAVPGVFAKEFAADCSIIDASPDFATFYIRNNNSVPLDERISPPWDEDMILVENAAGDGYSFSTPRGGQKVGYGTTFFDGLRVNSIETVDWTKVSGMNDGIVTYLNFWVTDGTNYAVIASENQYQGTLFANRTEWKIFEFDNAGGLNWLFDDGSTGARDGAGYLTSNSVRVNLSQLGDKIVLADPGMPYPSYVGTGAPRGGYGMNLIWGDTQANFEQKSGQIEDLYVKVFATKYYASN